MVRSVGGAPETGELRLELLVDECRDPQQLFLAEIRRRDGIAAVAVDPVEDADVVFSRVTERSLAMAARLGAYVERDAPSRGRLIHELRHRAAFTWQQAPADQGHADLVQ